MTILAGHLRKVAGFTLMRHHEKLISAGYFCYCHGSVSHDTD
jgi:hypothetical protein